MRFSIHVNAHLYRKYGLLYTSAKTRIKIVVFYIRLIVKLKLALIGLGISNWLETQFLDTNNALA